MRSRSAAVFVAVASLLAISVLTGCTAQQAKTTATRKVTAIGNGTGEATPDRAEMGFGVQFRAQGSVAAMNGATTRADKIIAALKQAGVKAEDMKTEQVSLDQVYGSRGTKVIAYYARQSVRVTTKDISAVGALIAAATGAGATSVDGPNFTMSDTNTARISAIEKAMADAKGNAGAMAKAAGGSLGRVISVTEAPGSGGPIPYYAERSFSPNAAALAPNIQPGQVAAQSQVTVVFELK